MDYVSVSFEVLSFQAGEPTGSQRCFTVGILEDNVIESPESFQLILIINETFRGSGNKIITILDSKMNH